MRTRDTMRPTSRAEVGGDLIDIGKCLGKFRRGFADDSTGMSRKRGSCANTVGNASTMRGESYHPIHDTVDVRSLSRLAAASH